MSSLPYENASSGQNALKDMHKILQSFGATSFGHMEDFETGDLLVQFTHRGRKVSVRANAKGYAKAWLKRHPYTSRMRSTREEHEAKAMKQGTISICSVLRDWVKGQVTAVETGVLSFEGAFLGQLMLPSGNTVLDEVHNSGVLKLTHEESSQ